MQAQTMISFIKDNITFPYDDDVPCVAGGGRERPLGRPASSRQRDRQHPEEHDTPERRDATPDGPQDHGEAGLKDDSTA